MELIVIVSILFALVEVAYKAWADGRDPGSHDQLNPELVISDPRMGASYGRSHTQ